jgi:predicted nucleotidyltransferase
MLSSEDIIKFLKDNQLYLKQNFFVIEIGLFGSFARNEQKENSDIDILVEFAPGTPDLYDKELQLKAYLGNHFNRKVDICSKKWIKPIFRPMVLNDVRYAY